VISVFAPLAAALRLLLAVAASATSLRLLAASKSPDPRPASPVREKLKYRSSLALRVPADETCVTGIWSQVVLSVIVPLIANTIVVPGAPASRITM
jgi:hypothetical protein